MIMVTSLVLGCGGKDNAVVAEGDSADPLDAFTKDLEPGEMVFLPIIPQFEAAAGVYAENLLSNPGFEMGGQDWAVGWKVEGGGAAEVSRRDSVRTEGQFSLQLHTSPHEEVIVSQGIAPIPRRVHSVSAYVFAPGASEVTLELCDTTGALLMASEPASGPMTAWSFLTFSFYAAAPAGQAVLNVRCKSLGDEVSVLIDECTLFALPGENLLPSGTMESEPEEGRAPQWYLGGKSIRPEAEGYESKLAVELPAGSGNALIGLIPASPEVENQELLIAAMLRRLPGGSRVSPEVTLALNTAGSEDERPAVSATDPASGTWEEIALSGRIPARSEAEQTSAVPFHVIQIERLPGSDGQVFVDEVVVNSVPDDFKGVLRLQPASSP